MSPRPCKPRRCRCRCCGEAFKPAGTPMSELEEIPLRIDELEALRLCDMQGLSQEAAARRMRVSRGTVQRLAASARQKTASALCRGQAIVFEGHPTSGGTR